MVYVPNANPPESTEVMLIPVVVPVPEMIWPLATKPDVTDSTAKSVLAVVHVATTWHDDVALTTIPVPELVGMADNL